MNREQEMSDVEFDDEQIDQEKTERLDLIDKAENNKVTAVDRFLGLFSAKKRWDNRIIKLDAASALAELQKREERDRTFDELIEMGRMENEEERNSARLAEEVASRGGLDIDLDALAVVKADAFARAEEVFAAFEAKVDEIRSSRDHVSDGVVEDAEVKGGGRVDDEAIHQSVEAHEISGSVVRANELAAEESEFDDLYQELAMQWMMDNNSDRLYSVFSGNISDDNYLLSKDGDVSPFKPADLLGAAGEKIAQAALDTYQDRMLDEEEDGDYIDTENIEVGEPDGLEVASDSDARENEELDNVVTLDDKRLEKSKVDADVVLSEHPDELVESDFEGQDDEEGEEELRVVNAPEPLPFQTAIKTEQSGAKSVVSKQPDGIDLMADFEDSKAAAINFGAGKDKHGNDFESADGHEVEDEDEGDGEGDGEGEGEGHGEDLYELEEDASEQKEDTSDFEIVAAEYDNVLDVLDSIGFSFSSYRKIEKMFSNGVINERKVRNLVDDAMSVIDPQGDHAMNDDQKRAFELLSAFVLKNTGLEIIWPAQGEVYDAKSGKFALGGAERTAGIPFESIARVQEAGFMKNGKVIRPARVIRSMQ